VINVIFLILNHLSFRLKQEDSVGV
jgi:hypothetical protein